MRGVQVGSGPSSKVSAIRRPTGASTGTRRGPSTRQIAAELRSAESLPRVGAMPLLPVVAVDSPCAASSRRRPQSVSASSHQCAGGRSMLRPTRRADSLLGRTGNMLDRSRSSRVVSLKGRWDSSARRDSARPRSRWTWSGWTRRPRPSGPIHRRMRSSWVGRARWWPARHCPAESPTADSRVPSGPWCRTADSRWRCSLSRRSIPPVHSERVRSPGALRRSRVNRWRIRLHSTDRLAPWRCSRVTTPASSASATGTTSERPSATARTRVGGHPTAAEGPREPRPPRLRLAGTAAAAVRIRSARPRARPTIRRPAGRRSSPPAVRHVSAGVPRRRRRVAGRSRWSSAGLVVAW